MGLSTCATTYKGRNILTAMISDIDALSNV